MLGAILSTQRSTVHSENNLQIIEIIRAAQTPAPSTCGRAALPDAVLFLGSLHFPSGAFAAWRYGRDFDHADGCRGGLHTSAGHALYFGDERQRGGGHVFVPDIICNYGHHHDARPHH